MYTQCPHCKTAFRIDLAKLRQARGEVLCQHCHIIFNALNSLSETLGGLSRKDGQNSALPPVLGERDTVGGAARSDRTREMENHRDGLPSMRVGSRQPAPPRGGGNKGAGSDRESPPGASPRWWFGSLALAALLSWQLSVFESERLLHSEALRPWLELACESLSCELPAYRDTSRIQVVDRALLPAPDDLDGYEFSLILANQSSLAQAFPSIKLVLSELTGRAIASRTFTPAEYLGATHPSKMPVGKPFEIRLLLAKPSREVGGFSFELI